jgi:predicted nucleic acid-binding protein
MGNRQEVPEMIVIADTGPLLHLFWVGASSWALPPQQILVVDEVWREVEAYEPAALQDARLQRVTSGGPLAPSLTGWKLDAGERAALNCALAQQATDEVLVLCDEIRARRACRVLSLPVIGSVGLIVEAFRAGRVSGKQAAESLHDLPSQGRFYIKADLIHEALKSIDAQGKDKGASADNRTD